jgi:hypothetical protein
LRISSDIVAQHDCFRDFLHGYTFLAALALQRQIGLLFVQAEITLQNAFGALDDFPGLQLFGESGVGLLEARQFKFGAYEKSYCGDHADLATAIDVVLAMLQIDDTHDATAAHQGHRQKCLVTVFRQFVEKLEARIVRRVFGNGYRFAMFRYPSGNALSDTKFQPVDYLEASGFPIPETIPIGGEDPQVP